MTPGRRVLGRRGLLTGLAASGAVTLLGGCGSPEAPAGPGRPGGSSAGAGPITRHAYGDLPDQFGVLHRPRGRGHGVVVMIHGGYWSDEYGLDLNAPVSRDLARRGWAVWNIEYRRLGGRGRSRGGWPRTGDDVFAAIDHLATLLPDHRHGPVVAIGHSAGGQLAAVAAGRKHGPVRVDAAIAQAGVLDLEYGARTGLGNGAVVAFLGGRPGDVPRAYAEASPRALLPFPTPVTCVHSPDDQVVPFRQSLRFFARARVTGADGVRLARAEGGHFDLIDPRSAAWHLTVRELERLTRR